MCAAPALCLGPFYSFLEAQRNTHTLMNPKCSCTLLSPLVPHITQYRTLWNSMLVSTLPQPPFIVTKHNSLMLKGLSFTFFYTLS